MAKLTAIIPAYNRSASLRVAVASVLSQSFADFELIVVDDGSSENIELALAAEKTDRRVKIVHHSENRGSSAARNTGIRLATSDFVAFLDSDDAWQPKKLERQLAWMDLKKEAVSCTGYLITRSFDPKPEARVPRAIEFSDLCWGCITSPGSTMIAKTHLFDVVGTFNESLRRLEDFEWLLRCCQSTGVGVVPEILAFIQGRNRETYPFEDVRKSAALIETYVLEDRYPFDRREKRILRSTLQSEIAAGAFLRRKYISAAACLCRSLYLHPFKKPEYYGRLMRAVKSDVYKAMARVPLLWVALVLCN